MTTSPPTFGADGRSGILVTGAHRSGTTWLGRLLASADELHYVQEPFNIVAHTRWTDHRAPRQFWYAHDDDGWSHEIERVSRLRPPLLASLPDAARARRLRRVARLHVDAARARRSGQRPLMKDPIAIFSTPHLVEQYGFVPVILVRDAVSFVGSLKARDWTFDFSHWIDQPLLMERILSAHRAAIEARPDDLIEQGIVQWNAIYGAVADFAIEHPEWLVVEYEQLATDPDVQIPRLFDVLGLRFGADQQQVLHALSRGSGGDGVSAIDVRRDSAEALTTWSTRLSDAEVALIREQTADTATRVAEAVRVL